MNKFNILKKFFYLINNKKLFFLLVPFMFISSILDLFSLASVAILINIILDSPINSNYSFIPFLDLNKIDFSGLNNFIFYSILIIITFF